MSHSIANALPWGKGSIAYFSKASPVRLLVFVHGFGGGAAATWKGAETALTTDPKTANCDIVFFGYSSLRAQPENSAGLLRGFLNDAVGHQRRWKGLAAPARPGAPVPHYDEILIVAHSLGAAVARRAVLDGLKVGATWASSTRLVLFGPAHLGAVPLKLRHELGGVIGTIVGTLLAITKVRIASLDALEPDSRFLTTLLHDSEREFANGWHESVTARQVIFGYGDNVVISGTFFQDPPADVWPGHDHCSVCRVPETSETILSHLD